MEKNTNKTKIKSKKVLFKRVLAFMLALLLAFNFDGVASLGNAMSRVFGDAISPDILIGGNSTKLDSSGKPEAFVTYGSTIELTLIGETTDVYYLFSANVNADGTFEQGDMNIISTPGSAPNKLTFPITPVPGVYYLVSPDIDKDLLKVYNGFEVIKSRLSSPTGTVWEGKTAKWEAVTKDYYSGSTINDDVTVNYEVQLKKDDVVVDTQTVTTTEFDFTPVMEAQGYGTYTFSVKALPNDAGTDRYEASASALCDDVYDFVDTVAPVITSYDVDGQRLVANVTDDVKVEKFIFTTATDAPDAADPAWVTVADSQVTDGVATLESNDIISSGVWYLYAKDNSGNVVKSSPIYSTKVNVYKTPVDNETYSDGARDVTLKNEITESKVFFSTDENLGTISINVHGADGITNGTKAGFALQGWYNSADYSGSAFTAVKPSSVGTAPSVDGSALVVPAGTDCNIYAKWTAQAYTITLVNGLGATSYTYSGMSATGIPMNATLEQKDAESVVYQWYKVVEDGDVILCGTGTTDSDDINKNTYNIKTVPESGEYYVKATVTVAGRTEYATSNHITATVLPAALTVNIKNETIEFGTKLDANGVPTTLADGFTITDTVTGLVGGETIASLTAAGKFTLGKLVTDYDPTNPSKKGAGSYSITDNGDDALKTKAENYTVTVNPATLTVSAKNVEAEFNNVVIKFKAEGDTYSDTFSKTYTGSAITPEIAVFDGDESGIEIDTSYYDVSYEDNINAGTAAKVVVTFKGNYSGTLKHDFTINKDHYDITASLKNEGVAVNTWKYGSMKPTASVLEIRDGAVEKFYYRLKSQTVGTELGDTATATLVQPVDAGTYYMWAVVEECINYERTVSPAVEFTIVPRDITFTAASRTVALGNSFVYDGNTYTDATYTQTGDGFVASEGLRSITVTGSISTIGTVDNVITYSLTPTTKASNYNITVVNGKLEMTASVLTAPSGITWKEKGLVEWTPVSLKDIEVSYKAVLYRKLSETETEFITEVNTDNDFCSFEDAIRADVADNYTTDKGCEYAVEVQSVPKAVANTPYTNYTSSAFSDPVAGFHAVKVIAQKDANFENISIIRCTELENGVYRRETAADATEVILLEGDNAAILTTYKNGYVYNEWVYDKEKISLQPRAIGIEGEEDYVVVRMATLMLGNVNGTSDLYITAQSKDAPATIREFSAQNNPSDNYENVKVKIDVVDPVGFGETGGYALVQANATTIKKFNVNTISDWTPFGGPSGYEYKEDVTIDTNGSYYLVVKDKSGNVTISENPVVIYKITFGNGKKAGEEDSQYGSESMHFMLKVSGSTITLRDNIFTKTGHSFKNWYTDDGVLYANEASYSANANADLHAEWSADKYAYTVKYYYANVDNTYDESVFTTKEFSGGYHQSVESSTAAIQELRAGFVLDTDKAGSPVVLGPEKPDPVIKVYYKRQSFPIVYKYTDPTAGTEKTLINNNIIYGATYPVPGVGEALAVPTFTGYEFSGWDYGDFDSSETTMPAKPIEVRGSYTANQLTYKVVFYGQNLPSSVNFADNGTYTETAAETYYIMGETEISSPDFIQGYSVTYTCNIAYEGYTQKKIVVTRGAEGGATIPDGASVSNTVTDKLDAANYMYINVYYDRNIYDVTLNVWRDKRDINENLMFTNTWSVSYGTDMSAFTDKMEKFGYSETGTENEWINGSQHKEHDFFDESGAIKDEFKAYTLADYTDWSSGVAPKTMPNGGVKITKEYIKNTTAQYSVQFYLQTLDEEQNVIYKDEPTYSVYYYGNIGANIVINGNAETDSEKTGYDIDKLNYKYLLDILDANAAAYEFDEAPDGLANNLSGTVILDEDNPLILKVYFKRTKVPVKITYYYYPSSGAENEKIKIQQFYQWAVWGTKMQIDLARFYYADSTAVSSSASVAPDDNDYSDVSVDSTYEENDPEKDYVAKSYNLAEKNCEISYSSRTWTVSGGYSYPNALVNGPVSGSSGSSAWKWVSPDDDELTRESPYAHCYINMPVGQGGYIAPNELAGRMTYVDIFYSELAPNITYTPDVMASTISDKTFDLIEYLESETVDGNTVYTIVNGSNVNGTYKVESVSAKPYKIRIVNKKDVFESTFEPRADKYSYYLAYSDVNDYTNPNEGDDRTYAYTSTLKNGFKPMTIKEGATTVTYYMLDSNSDGAPDNDYIYIVDKSNSFFRGHRITFDIEGVNSQNPLLLGTTHAAAMLRSGYRYYHENTYGPYIDGNNGINTSHIYVYRDDVTPPKILRFILGNKTSNKTIESGSSYTLCTDPYVSTTFKVEAGYRIVWYEDQAFTKPVDTNTYVITQDKTFYGRREKGLIDNLIYISYELPRRLSDESALRTQFGFADNYYYVKEDNYTKATWQEVEGLDATVDKVGNSINTVGGHTYRIVREPFEKIYYDNQFGETKPVNYVAERVEYYIDNYLVMIKEDNKSLTFSPISLEYKNTKYQLDGYGFDEKDTNNKINGYCQREPVTLNVFYYRKNYQLETGTPNFATPEDLTDITYNGLIYTYGSPITIGNDTENNPGYSFTGFTVEKYFGGEYIPVTADELSEMVYTYVPNTEGSIGKTTFEMPRFDLRLIPNWTPDAADFNIYSYYQKIDESYGISELDKLVANGKASDCFVNSFDVADGSVPFKVVYEGKTYGDESDAKLIYSDSGKGTIIGAAITCDTKIINSSLNPSVAASANPGKATYYFAVNTLNDKDDYKYVSVTAADVIGSVSVAHLAPGDKHAVSNYVDKAVISESDFGADKNPIDLKIYGYTYSTLTTVGGAVATLKSTDTFTVATGMTFRNFYSRNVKYKTRVSVTADDHKASDDNASGAVVQGDFDNVQYGEEITLTAQVAEGYEFVGWFSAKDIVRDYDFSAYNRAKVSTDDFVDGYITKQTINLTVGGDAGENNSRIYKATVKVYEDSDYIAVTRPITFAGDYLVKVTIKAGTTDYTYGYEASDNQTLTAILDIPDAVKGQVEPISYQWYKVTSADGETTDVTRIEGATNPVYQVETGLNAGTHYYQCVAVIRQIKNGRINSAKASSAYPLMVKPVGQYVHCSGYDNVYDGNAHSINVYFDYDTVTNYKIYYSDKPMNIWYNGAPAYIKPDYLANVAGNTDQIQSVTSYVDGDGTTHNIPAQANYTNVELNGSGDPESHEIYYYVRTEEEGLSPNYKDTYGSATVKIRPRELTILRNKPYTKTYDAKTELTTEQFREIFDTTEGSVGWKYYNITDTMFRAEALGTGAFIRIDGDGTFNDSHVDTANAITLSKLKVVYAKDTDITDKGVTASKTAGDINYNYIVNAASISAYIVPYQINLSWTEDNTFMYDGTEHSATPSIVGTAESLPDRSAVEIGVSGKQKNANIKLLDGKYESYNSTAQLVTESKPYHAADYKLYNVTKSYTITQRPVTIYPQDDAVIYDGTTHKLTSYKIKDNTTSSVSDITVTDGYGTATTLPGGKILMSTLSSNKGYKNAGTYNDISAIVDNTRIYDSTGAEITFNYELHQGEGTLEIKKRKLKVSVDRGINKEFDNTTTGELFTASKTINGVSTSVITSKDGNNVLVGRDSSAGIVAGEKVYLSAAGVSDINFADANVGTDKTVTFTVGTNPFVGEDAANYEYDTTSDTTALANIDTYQVTVKVKDVTSIYGEAPSYEVEYVGLRGGDTAAIVTGKPVFVVDGKDVHLDGGSFTGKYVDGTAKYIPASTSTYDITLKTGAGGYVEGISSSNYKFVFAADDHKGALTVNKRHVAVNGKDRASVISKVYDSTTEVKETLTLDTDYTLDKVNDASDTGVLTEDKSKLDVTGTAVYNSANVAAANKINVTSVELTGDAKNNYVLDNTSYSVSAAITHAPLTVTADSMTATYGNGALTNTRTSETATVYTAIATGYVGSDRTGGELVGDVYQKVLTNGSGITLTTDYAFSSTDNTHCVVGTYPITPSALTDTNYYILTSVNGNVTVNKATVYITAQKNTSALDKTISIVYGKDILPLRDNVKVVTEGWLYEDEGNTSVFTDAMKAQLALEPVAIKKVGEDGYLTFETGTATDPYKEASKNYPYTATGYELKVGESDTPSATPFTAGNYNFAYKPAKLMVGKQFISIHDITGGTKVYDGNSNAAPALDFTSAAFDCYVSGGDRKTYTVREVFGLPEGATDDEVKAKIAENIEVIATYKPKEGSSLGTKDVENDKPIEFTLSLKTGSYLAQRYELINTTDKAAEIKADYGIGGDVNVTQNTTTGEITKREIGIFLYYGETDTSTIQYGDDIDITNFKWELVKGEFATVSGTKADEDEGIWNPTDKTIKGLAGSIEFRLVDTSGNIYTNKSGAGTYYIKQTGLSGGNNYILKIMASALDVEGSDGSNFTVDKNKLRTPAPVWVVANPGTVKWDAVPNISDVKVDKYVVTLHEGSATGAPVDTRDISYVEGRSDYTVDYAEIIRRNGAGAYYVTVKAIAGHENNADNCNVEDSDNGNSIVLYAANVSVAYSDDADTAAAATTVTNAVSPNKDKSSSLVLKLKNSEDIPESWVTSKVVIDGEALNIKADWYNKDGYRTGYKLAQTPWKATVGVTAGTVSTTSDTATAKLSNVNDSSGVGAYTADSKMHFTSADNVALVLTLVPRPATLSVDVDVTNSPVAYGYAAGDAPKLTANAASVDDNITSADYVYTYSWSRVSGDISAISDTTNEKDITAKTGLAAATYLLKVTVVATRKDNGETKTLSPSTNFRVKKATLDPEKVEAKSDDWTYGEVREVPDIKAITGVIPPKSEIGTIHYYYATSATATEKTEWCYEEYSTESHLSEYHDVTPPMNGGTYYLWATVDANDNYDAVSTNSYTTFTISPDKLKYKSKLSEMNYVKDTVFESSDLHVGSTSTVPYGMANWIGVFGPEENGDGYTRTSEEADRNYINVGYKVKLYRYNSSEGSDATLIKEYLPSDVTVTYERPTGTFLTYPECTLDMSHEMNKEGKYYFEVQPLSSNTVNCLDGDPVRSPDYVIGAELHIRIDGNSTDETEKTIERVYDGKDVILYVDEGADTTYQWYKNGSIIDGATSSQYKVRYVEESAIYSCKVKHGEADPEDTTFATVTIKPRTITLKSMSDEKKYTGTPLTNANWWIGENIATDATLDSNGNPAIGPVASGTELVEAATGNTVSGVLVIGTSTNVAYSGETVTTADNTISYSGGGLVIKEVTTNKIVYDASMETAGTANYEITEAPGKLKITPRIITVTAGSKTKKYDGAALTDSSVTVGGDGLADGEAITATMTAASTQTVYGTKSNVIDSLVIKKGGTTIPLGNYIITKNTGLLTVNKRPLGTGATYESYISIADITDLIYDNTAKEPDFTIVDNARMDTGAAANTNLVKASDYSYSYSNNVMAGTATITITGIGNYSGTITKNFKIVDNVAPVITHVASDNTVHDNGKYCEQVTISTSDPNLKSVVITRKSDGTVIKEATEFTDNSFTFTLVGGPSDVSGTVYTVTVKDSDNTTTQDITLYEKHLFTNYTQDLTEDSEGHVYKAPCDRESGAVDYCYKAWGKIEWDYEYTYLIDGAGDTQDGVQGVSARATFVKVELLKDGTVIATRIVDCDSTCGVGALPLKDTDYVNFVFEKYNKNNPLATESECNDRIPVGDGYSVRSTIGTYDGTTFTKVRDYRTTIDIKWRNDANTADGYGYYALYEYEPECFDVPWKVVIKELPKNESGDMLYPSAVYVKLMFAYDENADDTETDTGYQIISQMTGVGDKGVKCLPVVNDDGTVSYTGSYPVWKFKGGGTDSYYHRIQVVGFEYDGTYYDVENRNPKLKSINDSDHVNHTIYYVAGGVPEGQSQDIGQASGTILYELGNPVMPMVYFDYNLGIDTGSPATGTYTTITKSSFGLPVTESEISGADPTRGGYDFDGWYTESTGGTKVTSIPSLDGYVKLYAHWLKAENFIAFKTVTRKAPGDRLGGGQYKISKVNSDGSKSDADFAIIPHATEYDDDSMFTKDEKNKLIYKLTPGRYEISSVTAPAGYDNGEPVTFYVGSDGRAYKNSSCTVLYDGNEVVFVHTPIKNMAVDVLFNGDNVFRKVVRPNKLRVQLYYYTGSTFNYDPLTKVITADSYGKYGEEVFLTVDSNAESSPSDYVLNYIYKDVPKCLEDGTACSYAAVLNLDSDVYDTTYVSRTETLETIKLSFNGNTANRYVSVVNDTENKIEGISTDFATNAGGIVGVTPEAQEHLADAEHEADYSEVGFKTGKLPVYWKPMDDWTFANAFTVSYSENDGTSHEITITGFIDEDGNLITDMTAPCYADLIVRYPNSAIQMTGNGSIVLTLADTTSGTGLPFLNNVTISFLPTIAVINTTKGAEGGFVKIEGGEYRANSDGIGENSDDRHVNKNKAYASAKDGYYIDLNNIEIGIVDAVLRKTAKLNTDRSGFMNAKLLPAYSGLGVLRPISYATGASAKLNLNADLEFDVIIVYEMAGIHSDYEIAGKINVLTTDSLGRPTEIEMEFTKLPIPIDIGIHFNEPAKPQPSSTPDNGDDSEDDDDDHASEESQSPSELSEQVRPNKDAPVPKTGDSTDVIWSMLILLVSSAVFGAAWICEEEKKKKA